MYHRVSCLEICTAMWILTAYKRDLFVGLALKLLYSISGT